MALSNRSPVSIVTCSLEHLAHSVETRQPMRKLLQPRKRLRCDYYCWNGLSQLVCMSVSRVAT